MAPHSSTLAWKIPWMEEPGRLQSLGSRRVGHVWVTSLSFFTFMHWRRKGNPLPCSCLENPRDSGDWWAAIYGVAQSRTQLKRLSSSSSSSRRLPRSTGEVEWWDNPGEEISLLFSHSVVSYPLQRHRLQHIKLPCPSLSLGVCSNSCPLSCWCHPTISSSVIPFSSWHQFFLESGSFQMSQLFTSSGLPVQSFQWILRVEFL